MKNSNFYSRRASRVFVASLFASICGLTGCLSRPALHKQTFAFNAPAIPSAKAVAGDRVLGIRKLQIAPPFDTRSLVYRTGEFSYVRDPYAEFLDSPDEELLAPVRGWLRRDGGFGAVVEAGGALKPNTLVEINVTQLFGDFRQSKSPTAILTMRFVFFDARNGIPGTAILQQEYSRSITLKSASAAALVQGWNQALGEILTEAASDVRQPK
jgi:uncharacterized lipoprotein YmbA